MDMITTYGYVYHDGYMYHGLWSTSNRIALLRNYARNNMESLQKTASPEAALMRWLATFSLAPEAFTQVRHGLDILAPRCC